MLGLAQCSKSRTGMAMGDAFPWSLTPRNRSVYPEMGCGQHEALHPPAPAGIWDGAAWWEGVLFILITLSSSQLEHRQKPSPKAARGWGASPKPAIPGDPAGTGRASRTSPGVLAPHPARGKRTPLRSLLRPFPALPARSRRRGSAATSRPPREAPGSPGSTTTTTHPPPRDRVKGSGSLLRYGEREQPQHSPVWGLKPNTSTPHRKMGGCTGTPPPAAHQSSRDLKLSAHPRAAQFPLIQTLFGLPGTPLQSHPRHSTKALGVRCKDFPTPAALPSSIFPPSRTQHPQQRDTGPSGKPKRGCC